MKLYEIEQAILDCIDYETGEIIDVEAFDNLQIERRTKIDNIICLYKNSQAEAAAIKAEEQALAERRKAKENNAERIKQWLSRILNGEKFDMPRNAISWRKSESVNITDEYAIDDEYTEIVSTLKIDKTAIKNAIKKGIQVAGAEIITKNNIQIR